MRGLCRGEATGLCAFGGGAEVECRAPESLEEGACEGKEGAPGVLGVSCIRNLLGLSFKW